MPEDKITLTCLRAELITKLTGALSPIERSRVQENLSIVNTKIKALNTIEAAQLKATADRRKAAGLAEAQANASRSRGHLRAPLSLAEVTAEIIKIDEEGDPALAIMIDNWIIAVLRRGGLKVQLASDGNLDILDVPAKWVRIIDALGAGIHAAARGEPLPEVTEAPKTAKKRG